MSNPVKSSVATPTRQTIQNTSNDSRIREEIEEIEESAQSHNVIIIQKQLNAKRFKEMKPNEVDERLYYIDKEQRDNRLKEAVQQREEELSRLAAASEKNDITGINPHSLELTSKIDQDFLGRTTEWQEKKVKRLESKREEQIEEQKRELEKTTQFRAHVNKNIDAGSRVKDFVGALDQIAEHKKAQRQLYGKSQERRPKSPNSKSKSPVPSPNIFLQEDFSEGKARNEAKVVSSSPMLVSGQQGPESGAQKDRAKSPIRHIPVPMSDNWKKTNIVEFRGALKNAIHN